MSCRVRRIDCRYVALIVCMGLTLAASAQHGATGGEWPVYAGDAGSTKYAPLDQINADNVRDLRTAWVWDSIDKTVLDSGVQVWHGAFEATPLMVNGVLYVVTSFNQVAALRPESGELIWKYDPESYKSQRLAPNKGFIHRGLAYWADGANERIILATVDAWLIALDAKTGKPIPEFGEDGRVDLTKGLRHPVARNGRYGVNSPPVICQDVIVVGSTVMDGVIRKEGTPGGVRGYDVRTGKRLWTFNTVAQDGEFGSETWEEGSAVYTGSANVWPPFSADEDLGYVYLPISCATNNFYGGHRPGDDLFSQSLVCLDAKTGRRVWHFQMVHHGIWDYDPPCAPNLIDITVDGKQIKAVAQLTKQAFTFVFDRATGEPVWPIKERAVAQSAVPGERTSPTQPFPTRPPPFDRQGVSPDDLVDFTPEIKAEAVKILERYEYGPLYTPASERGTIMLPGWGGGGNWNGGAFDPETGVLYVPSLTTPSRLKMGKPDPARSNFRYMTSASVQIAGPFDLPLIKPPWARITALDMNKGELLWTVPHGSPVKGPEDIPGSLSEESKIELARKLHGRILGGAVFSPALVTKSLLFVGVGRASGVAPLGPPLFQAFDKATGRLVWETELPANTTGGPMTYMSAGKQYIVVATGGGRRGPAAALVALSLP